MDDLVSDGFLFDYPVWLCVRRDDPGRMVAGKLKDALFIAIFTDEDLAHRFLGAQGLSQEMQIGAIETPDLFRSFLKDVQKEGFSHIVFDDTGREQVSRRVCSISDLLATFNDEN